MKAVVIKKYGRAEVLQYTEIAKPEHKHDHLIVRMHATSVNPVDFKIRKGQLRFVTGFIRPKVKILGFDVAGEVVETGKNIKTFQKGDQIFALMGITKGGANAEYAAVPEGCAALKPSNLSFEESAAIPLASLTALQALRDRGKICSGKSVLINGASGGVGTFAVQIAKAFGAVVTGVCSFKNMELVESLGADNVIDYAKEDFIKHYQAYDIIFDVVANKTFSDCKKVLTPKGVYITTVPNPSIVFHIIWTSLCHGRKAAFVMVKPSGKDLDFIKELVETNKIRPVIDRVFPLSQVAAAHTYCEAGHTRGKSIITVV